MHYLRARSGGWKPLAKALGFSKYTLIHVKKGEKNVSPTMAFRVARLASVSIEDLLYGTFPPAGTCPHCGRNPPQESAASY